MRVPPETARRLGLEPHPEGGWYRQTYVSPVTLRPDGYDGARATATLIYYLLEPGDRSAWHTVRSDEIWLWHHGGPLRLLTTDPGPAPGADPRLHMLGPDLAAGQLLQALVPGGAWQSAEPAGGHEVLVSCLVTPGFDFTDFTLAAPDA
jgi:predicted cupin superfamily sugar epimerase